MAFDAFVLFDPGSIVHEAGALVGDKAAILVKTASAKLFAYSWYYTSAGRYRGFEALVEDAFRYAARAQQIAIDDAGYRKLVDAYSRLRPWPDVRRSLQLLNDGGIRLAVLSNLSQGMLASNLRAGELEQHFELVLSTDLVRAFKPARSAYAFAASALRLDSGRIGFAASADWDASGAKWFGYPTVWVNRSNEPAEPGHAAPDLVSSDMDGVLRLCGV